VRGSRAIVRDPLWRRCVNCGFMIIKDASGGWQLFYRELVGKVPNCETFGQNHSITC
jgi:hypothetical protein